MCITSLLKRSSHNTADNTIITIITWSSKVITINCLFVSTPIYNYEIEK